MGALGDILTMLAYFLAGIMAVGAVFGCTNTLLAAVAGRTHEIGALMAIGFKPWAIRIGFLLEALMLGLMGGIIGVLLAYSIDGVATGTMRYPGAEETVAQWRSLDGCSDVADTAAPPRDLDAAVEGPETTVTMYVDGCAGSSWVEFWRMEGSGHVPQLTDAFTSAVMDYFLGPIVP